eukprot:TRINITY_DN3279_c0_g1_i6.p2 TRINITY_DN3279_c0_g1~~TRINITY_DN3279_c0_g1_i6.p2  ORF type:complete len:218 (-),score=21.73 TRINITY_DN3279_c0_g1_i6:180-833(-)
MVQLFFFMQIQILLKRKQVITQKELTIYNIFWFYTRTRHSNNALLMSILIFQSHTQALAKASAIASFTIYEIISLPQEQEHCSSTPSKLLRIFISVPDNGTNTTAYLYVGISSPSTVGTKMGGSQTEGDSEGVSTSIAGTEMGGSQTEGEEAKRKAIRKVSLLLLQERRWVEVGQKVIQKVWSPVGFGCIVRMLLSRSRHRSSKLTCICQNVLVVHM